MICVYKITNPEGKIYIGGTKNYKKRLSYYKSVSCRKQIYIYESIQKYGYDNHVFEIIEICNIENLKERESYWGVYFDVLSNGLNSVLPKSKFSENKVMVSDSTRSKMSESKKGEKNYFYKCNHTEETKEKIRIAHTGKKHTEEHKRKVSLNNAKHNAKIVLDLETGIYYESAKEAAFYKNMVHSTLRSRLNGALKKNQLIYA
jgi:group I intron endonuclease